MSDSLAPNTQPSVDPELDLVAGQRVGEYVVEKKLGQGGFGAVFKAAHPLIGKEVAIKVLARKFSADQEMVDRFQAEARAVNQIRNRHIIDIFAFDRLDDGRHYYVMEMLEGEPLDAMIDRGPIALGTAMPILVPLAKALDAAHAKGIAHRDVKAENIFLVIEPDGAVFPKLLDFGIAKLLGNEETLKYKTRTGAPIGTPYYMSPEQCRGRDVDHRTDTYAFGVLVYRMLTGAYPHDGDDYMDILMKQIQNEPLPPSRLVDLPPGVDDAILWMMAKDPAARPPNLMSAVHALDVAAHAAGIVMTNGPRSSQWDAQSQPGMLRYATPPIAAMPRVSAAMTGAGTPVAGALQTMPGADALAATMAPGPAARSRTPMIAIAAVAALALGIVVFLAVRPGKDAGPATPTTSGTGPTTAATVPPTPPVTSPVVAADAGVAAVAVTVDAAELAPPPADAAPAAVPPPDAATKPIIPLIKVKRPPHGHVHGHSTTAPSHDDIEEAFPSQ